VITQEEIKVQSSTEAALLGAHNQKNQADARLGVLIGGQSILLHLTDVIEVLPVPPLQAVPLTKHWYLGVANVRGNLYSVSDLAQFLGWQPLPRTVSSRVVLISSIKTSQAAILIDAVLGLRHLNAMQLANPEKTENFLNTWSQQDINCFSPQIYMDAEEKPWFCLEMDNLVQDARFVQPSLA
jgi:twitching motility protein PilI